MQLVFDAVLRRLDIDVEVEADAFEELLGHRHDAHFDRDLDVLQTPQRFEQLEYFFLNKPMVYVSGNLLLFYERGNKRRHLSPDVFVVKGVAKHLRENYLLEIEVTAYVP